MSSHQGDTLLRSFNNNISIMSASNQAQVILHYLTPIVPVVYFLFAKTIAACLLQKPHKGPGLKWRRYSIVGLALSTVTTIIAEGVLTINRSIKEPQAWIPQDYVVYLTLLFAAHTAFTIGVLENSTPLWHPYFGAWLTALALETPIIVQQAVAGVPVDDTEKATYALSVLRAFFLLILSVVSGIFVLRNRTKSIKLDDETEALLANGNGETADHGESGRRPKSSRSRSTSESDDSSDDDDEDEDEGFDSGSEDPEQDKKLRKQQRKRLEASGNWFAYMSEYKIFLPMLWPSKDRFVQACLMVIGTTIVAERILNILVPRQLGIITTELAASVGTGIMPWHAIGLWMLYSALHSGAGVALIQEIAEVPVEQYTYKAVSTTAFRHIMGLSMDFHNEKNSGELIRAIEQGTNLQDLLNFLFFNVAPIFFDLIVALVYVYILFDIYMSLILLFVGVLYIWVGAKITVWNVGQRRKFNTAWRLESKVQNEAIHNWQTVAQFNRTAYESERYCRTVDNHCQEAWRYFLSYNLGGGAQFFIMTLGYACATILAAYRVSQGQAPIGSFVTLTAYWASIEQPLDSVTFSVRRIIQMMTDSERLLQLLQTKPTIIDAADASALTVPRGEVEFDNVSFAYDVRKPVLENVSFTVPAGTTVALVGETGGGKSTLLKLLYRYHDVHGGAIRIDGQDIRAVNLDSLREPFGIVPQDPALFNVSLLENLRYARLDASEAEVHAACRAAAIHDKILSFPDGYASLVGERGVKLSGGELQRIAIARAILRQPRIVLLDEATSMIDAETEAVIQAAFQHLTRARTTFIVAHRLSTIQHADLILVIGEGGILERGTHEELLRLNGKYVKLWSKQRSKETTTESGSSTAGEEDLIGLDKGDAGEGSA